MKSDFFIIAKSILAYAVTAQFYDRIIGLACALLAGLLGYFGKVIGQWVHKKFKEWWYRS